MIVFEGEVSKKCHHYIAKKEGKTSFWAMLVAVIAVLTPVSIFLSMAGAPCFAVAVVVVPIALLGVILPLIRTVSAVTT